MRYLLYKDVVGYWRWKLEADNNKIIADSSEGYFNEGDAIHGIELVKASSVAEVIVATHS